MHIVGAESQQADHHQQFIGMHSMKVAHVPALTIGWDELPYLTADREPYIEANTIGIGVTRTQDPLWGRAAAPARATERDMMCCEHLDESDSAESSYSSNQRRSVGELQPLRKRSRTVHEALELGGEMHDSQCNSASGQENWSTMDLEALCENVMPSALMVDVYNWMVDVVAVELCPSNRWWVQCGKRLIQETEGTGLLYE